MTANTEKYICITEKQSKVLNKLLGISDSDINAFCDGDELLVNYDYIISDATFDHEVSVEKSFEVELLNVTIFPTDHIYYNINDIKDFDLSQDQYDNLKQTAMKNAEDVQTDYELDRARERDENYN